MVDRHQIARRDSETLKQLGHLLAQDRELFGRLLDLVRAGQENEIGFVREWMRVVSESMDIL